MQRSRKSENESWEDYYNRDKQDLEHDEFISDIQEEEPDDNNMDF